MNTLINYSHTFRRHILLLAGICLTMYFSYHIVYGMRSYAHLQALDSAIIQKTLKLQALEEKHATLQTKVKMLRPGSINRDLLEERVQIVLGYKHPNEIQVPMN